MKKAYVKPEIYFESFELSANIATGCSMITKNLGEGTCGLEVSPGIFAFLTGITGCQYTEQDKDNPYGVCYHNPVDATKLFTS